MNKIEKSKYTHRSLARLVIEAKTPLSIGSGQKDIISDSLVMLDVNGLPYIPGTSIAGVVRSMVGPATDIEETYFGYQLSNKSHGSEIIFSEGRILNSKGEVVEGVASPAELEDALLSEYSRILPVRQHVCINDKGTAKKGGKFDRQVIYAGTRFCFEIELLSDGSRDNDFIDVLNAIHHKSFRIGGGVHNGFGQIEVVSLQTVTLDLRTAEDREKYLSKTSCLAETWLHWDNKITASTFHDDKYDTYALSLVAEDFLFFGSGFGDAKGDADMTTVKASRVFWSDDNRGELQKDLLLIPATSVKGALRHRVAYHHNRLLGRFVDGDPNNAPKDADNDEAVRAVFGYQDGKTLVAGKVLMSDIIENPTPSKLLNHVSIDRFTGGAIDGALFTEQVDYAKGRNFNLQILVKKDALSGDKVREAFESALSDLCHGMLPLGGGVNRGHGIFTESFTKTNEQ